MSARSYREWRVVRFMIGRRRLLLSTLAGVILLSLLPEHMRLATRLITSSSRPAPRPWPSWRSSPPSRASRAMGWG